MYQYDTIDREMLADRGAEFREQVARRLAGELNEDQFKPLRLRNGLYLQLHAYMLRIAIPYGSLNPTQLRKLAWIARTYDKGYGHFTTRTNLQLHWIKLRDAPDIMDHLASVDMHAIQTSGNCVLNVSADPYAGATAEEIDDTRVWAEAIRQWSMVHPEFSWLPRKFKIAVTAAPKDRTAAKTHDIEPMDRLMEWLPKNVPADDTTTIVHGDYQLYNLLYHPTEPRVVALLDWELSTLGHPMADLAYNCMKYHTHEAAALAEAGVPGEDEFIATYCKRAGRERIPHWNFYVAFGFFRLASIVQGVYKRGLQGNASSSAALSMKGVVDQTAATGWQVAQKG